MLPVGSALFGVVLLCTAPLSPMFQVSYAESMGLVLLFLALLLVQRRRFWLLHPVIVVMSLTRPSGLAFARSSCCTSSRASCRRSGRRRASVAERSGSR